MIYGPRDISKVIKGVEGNHHIALEHVVLNSAR
jgi:hypothetical protein